MKTAIVLVIFMKYYGATTVGGFTDMTACQKVAEAMQTHYQAITRCIEVK